MGNIGNVSRPLIALLVGTVAFFGLWIVALKPSSSSSAGGSSSGGVGQYQSAIDKAKQAVATSNAASQAHGGTIATTPTTSTAPASTPTTPAATGTSTASSSTSPTTATNASSSTPVQRLDTVDRALAEHKVVAMLFYNPPATDDQAVKQELAAVPTHGGSVVKLSIPLSEVANYTEVINQVPVNTSPTLVIIDRSGQATQIAGFTDSVEISQRVSDALAGQ